MPKCSLATWENRIRTSVAPVELPRAAVKKLAKKISRAHEAFTHEPTEEEAFELFKHIVYGDPTGDEAVAHVMDLEECTHQANASRRTLAAA